MRKVFIGGGVGNQLFQGCYAIAKGDISLIETANISLFLKCVAGWSIHHQWLDVHSIMSEYNVPVRRVGPCSFFALLGLKFFGSRQGEDSTHRLGRFSFGYFQDTRSQDIDVIFDVAGSINRRLPVVQDNDRYVAIHLRGGDFITGTSELVLSKQLQRFLEQEDLSRVVVTNDLERSQSLLGVDTRGFVYQGADELSDFMHLSKATVLFASDSTFNFWAAACGIDSGSLKQIYVNEESPLLKLYVALCDGRADLIIL